MPLIETWPGRVYAFIRLGRPLFLAGGFVMYGLGVSLALLAGARLNLPALLWGQLAVTAGQLMTHYANDYFDLAADRANRTPTTWSGGSRVLPEGELRPAVALAAACVFALVALLADIFLAAVVRPGGLTMPILLLAQALAWGYSAPPLKLHARGFGQVTAALVVAALTPLAGFYLQAGRLAPLPLLAAVPLFCLQFAMLLAVDVPDRAGDAAAGKRTLVVRIGQGRAARLYRLVLLSAYGSLPLLILAGLPPLIAAAAALPVPLAAWQLARVARDWMRPAAWPSLIFWSIGLLIGTAGLEALAALVISRAAG